MRSCLVLRASACAFASSLAVSVLSGCGSGPEEVTGHGSHGSDHEGSRAGSHGGSRGATLRMPTSCRVTGDSALGGGEGVSPAIAFGGGRYAVAWSDPAHGGAVVLTLADEGGRPVQEQRIPSAAVVAESVAPLDGGGFLLAWEEIAGARGTVRAVRLGADGTPRGAPFTVAASAGREAHPDVATTHDGALVAWTEAAGGRIGEVRGGALAGSHAIPGAAQVALAEAPGGDAAVWSAGPSIGFSRLPASLDARGGDMAVTTFRDAPGRANIPRLAAAPEGGFAVVWEDTRGGIDNEAVYLAMVDAHGRAAREQRVSPPGGSANYPDVAFVGGRAAVAYYQWRDHPTAVFLTLVDPETGRVGEDLKISGREAARFPRMASSGDGNLGVAYAEKGGPVHLARVTCE